MRTITHPSQLGAEHMAAAQDPETRLFADMQAARGLANMANAELAALSLLLIGENADMEEVDGLLPTTLEE